MTFFESIPWSNYNVVSFDYNDYSIVHGCTQFYGGLVTTDYLWIISRHPYLVGSPESNAFKQKVFAEVQKKVPHFDVNTINLSTHHADAGCKYLPLPDGATQPNPNDPTQTLPKGTVS